MVSKRWWRASKCGFYRYRENTLYLGLVGAAYKNSNEESSSAKSSYTRVAAIEQSLVEMRLLSVIDD
jgi:hypothetical protein